MPYIFPVKTHMGKEGRPRNEGARSAGYPVGPTPCSVFNWLGKSCRVVYFVVKCCAYMPDIKIHRPMPILIFRKQARWICSGYGVLP